MNEFSTTYFVKAIYFPSINTQNETKTRQVSFKKHLKWPVVPHVDTGGSFSSTGCPKLHCGSCNRLQGFCKRLQECFLWQITLKLTKVHVITLGGTPLHHGMSQPSHQTLHSHLQQKQVKFPSKNTQNDLWSPTLQQVVPSVQQDVQNG